MERFKDTDYIYVYSDYDYTMHMPSSDKLDGGYELKGKINGEPCYVEVLWKDVVKVNQISNVFKNQKVRFHKDIEDLAYRQLRIDISKEKNSFSRDEIEYMILHPDDSVLNKILAIDKIQVIDTFLSQLVYLKNTNKYFIAEKLEMYIRARKEEIEKGLKKSELEVDETENVETAVVEDEKETKNSKGKKSKTKDGE